MPDDLDELLRAAMKTLDDQVPSGYFEALPNQTLSRLEGSSMQGTTTSNREASMTMPPVEVDTAPVPKQAEREEDSGLHDIRNLAQSTKQRLSKRSITSQPINDDVLASSSGSWKNIALPQPAKMVSLPELADLPSKKEVLAAEKAAAKAEKKAAKAVAHEEVVAAAPVTATATATEASASTSIATERAAFSLPSMQQKRSKAPLFAVVGLGVAAAAGAVIYTQVSSKSEKSAAPAVAQVENTRAAEAPKAPEPAPAPAAVTTPPADQAAGSAEAVDEAKADTAVAGAAAPAPTEPAVEHSEHAKAKAAAGKASKKEVKVEAEKTTETKTETTAKPDKKGSGAAKGGDDGEPSFDALLKEAGVEDKKNDKPKLEKKSLTGDDFKEGMSAVSAKAQACYKGTQGTATVKLTISPSGAVSKVTVGGAFAGKPEAACVEAAVKGAKFPPWDGGPMSFTYAYMLSD